MPINTRKFKLDATIKSSIIKKIAAEVALAGGGVALDSYYKNPNYDKGGVYGKGNDPVFGKSDPPKSIDVTINVSTRARAIESAAKAADKIRATRPGR